MTPFILTQEGVSFVVKHRPVSLSTQDPKFPAILDALKGGADEASLDALLTAEARRLEAAAQALAEEATAITEKVSISVCGGIVLYNGKPAHPTITARMLTQLEQGFDLKPMARFLEKLMQNPSYRVVEHLYGFLEYGKNAITEDGDFLAYKAIRADWRDIHSGTMDNSIGQVVSVPRNSVDEDPNRTCSYGLHVCSFEYLPNFAHADGHVVVCKVSPADVVAIPSDYNNTKMRVCRYEVVGEYEGYYDERRDRYGTLSVASGTDDPQDFPFAVEVADPADGASFELHSRYEMLSEAAGEAEALVEDADYAGARVRVVNVTTGAVLMDRRNVFADDESDDSDDEDEGSEDDGGYLVEVEYADGSRSVYERNIGSVADARRIAADVDEPYLRVRVMDDRRLTTYFVMAQSGL